MHRTMPIVVLGSALVGTLFATAAIAQAPPDYGHDFVTVGAVGNAPFHATNPPSALVVGRGRVEYEYRIGRGEVTTAQWVEFLNTFHGNPAPHAFWDPSGAAHWGAFEGIDGRFRLRTDVPDAGNLPVAGITWRMSALYCNWLTNAKSPSPSSLITGAYDSTTWGVLPGTSGFGVTDAPNHLPGALFWIPTLDEQMKAVHYDPNRFGAGQGGWWLSKNRSDTPGTPGPPGVGTTSAGWQDPNVWLGEWNIPLGSYPDSRSPWGLLDTSGGAPEWNEHLYVADFPAARLYMSSGAGIPFTAFKESIYGQFSIHPGSSQETGLRLASAVPTPGIVCWILLAGLVRLRHRRQS